MAEKKFEEALARLETIVQTLEQGDLPLDKALASFEEGMELVKFCTAKLEEAEKKVTMLVEESGQGVNRVPFEPEEESHGA